MLDFKNLRESIKSLFGDEKLTPEQAETLGKVSGQIDMMEKEVKTFQDSHEELRTKYVELVRNTTIDKPLPSGEEDKPTDKSLFDFLKEEANKRNK